MLRRWDRHGRGSGVSGFSSANTGQQGRSGGARQEVRAGAGAPCGWTFGRSRAVGNGQRWPGRLERGPLSHVVGFVGRFLKASDAAGRMKKAEML